MKNNKVLMSLVVASISAMAASPFVLEADAENNSHASSSNNNNSNQDSDIKKNENIASKTQETVAKQNISIEAILSATLMSGEDNLKVQKELTEQTVAMLNKKDTLQPLYESISIVAENYGSHSDKVMRKEIYDEFNFGYTDSTASGGYGSATYGAQPAACHWACHSACHSACHGSRGWR